MRTVAFRLSIRSLSQSTRGRIPKSKGMAKLHLLALALCFFTLSCGQAAIGASGSPTPSASQGKNDTGQNVQSAPSGKVVVGMTVDANSLDFMRMNTTNPEFTLASHIFDTLVARANDMQIKPSLAESWNLVNDLTWEFKLRKGVKFHNGEPFNAAAVKFTFDRATNPATKSADQVVRYIDFDRVDVIDDYTVRIVTKSPAPAMLARLALFYMLPPKYYSENSMETVASKPVGTGAFKFVEWVKNDHITLEANPEYFAGPPSIKTLVFRPIPEVGTRLAELKSGGIDIAIGIPPDQAKSVESGTTRLESVEGGRRIIVGFHIAKGSPIEDKRVRQAINYAVDVDTITKSLLGGYGQRRFTLVTPPNASPNIKPWPYDPEKAKQLLAEAGCPNGFSITLDTPSGRYIKDKEVAEAIADYLTKIGITTTVKSFDWSTYTTQLLMPKKSDPMFLLGFSSNFDPVLDMAMLDYQSALNPTEWNNEQFQSLLKQIYTTMDDTKRQELIYKAQELANEEAPIIWMYFQPDLYGVNKRLDWKPRVDEYVLLHKAKIVK